MIQEFQTAGTRHWHLIGFRNDVQGFPSASAIKNPFAMQEMQIQSLGWEDSLEEGMATHSSILAWKIPQTEEPDRLQSVEL